MMHGVSGSRIDGYAHHKEEWDVHERSHYGWNHSTRDAAAISRNETCIHLRRSKSVGPHLEDGQAIDWIEHLDISCTLPGQSIYCIYACDSPATNADTDPFSTFILALLDLASS